MKILATAFSEVKIILYDKIYDDRGSFSEFMKESDGFSIRQVSESFSKKRTLRGLHMQYDPPLSKMVRVVAGSCMFIVLDIRPKSSTQGKAILVKKASVMDEKHTSWLKIPFGFASGFLAMEDSIVEYLFDEEYSEYTNISVSYNDPNIDWSLTTAPYKNAYQFFIDTNKLIISEKDREALSLLDLIGKKELFE